MNKRKQDPVTKKLDSLIIPHQILDENNWKTYVEDCCSDIPLNGYYDAIKDVSSELQSLLDRAKDFNELKNELNLFINKRQKFMNVVSDSWNFEDNCSSNNKSDTGQEVNVDVSAPQTFEEVLYRAVKQVLKV